MIRSQFIMAESGESAKLSLLETAGLLETKLAKGLLLAILKKQNPDGGFPRLAEAMELTGSSWGLRIDEPNCLEVLDGKLVRVRGRGRAYFLKRLGSLKFEVRVLEPGDELELRRA